MAKKSGRPATQISEQDIKEFWREVAREEPQLATLAGYYCDKALLFAREELLRSKGVSLPKVW